MIDGFAAGSIKEITGALTAVGFSSPPNWIKPYHVLSNGERFRCDLARAILEGGELVVFDEFTSVVDRTVATHRIGGGGQGDSPHGPAVRGAFPAITTSPPGSSRIGCWTCRAARLSGGGFGGRPSAWTSIDRHASAWPLFAKYHYLSGGLNRTAHCYLGMIDGAAGGVLRGAAGDRLRRPAEDLPARGRGPIFRASAWAGPMLDAVAAMYPRMSITTGHPAMIAALKNDAAVEMHGGQEDGPCQAHGHAAEDRRRTDPDVVPRPHRVQL